MGQLNYNEEATYFCQKVKLMVQTDRFSDLLTQLNKNLL